MFMGQGQGTVELKLAPARERPESSGSITRAQATGTALTTRVGRLLAGLALFALGLSLMIRANLGLSAWDVFHDALRSMTPLTFGQVVVVVSVLVLLAGIALGVQPGPGTVGNAVLVGVFTDAILKAPILEDLASASLGPRLAVMLAGVWGIALGSALYISANLGAGPRDGLMLGLAMRTGRSAGAARTAIEATILVAGVILGGSAGLGTAVFVILIGPAIDASFRLFGMQPPRDKPRMHPLKRAVRASRAWAQSSQVGPYRREKPHGIPADAADQVDERKTD
jgi:uncharacterized membrane protein YczE